MNQQSFPPPQVPAPVPAPVEYQPSPSSTLPPVHNGNAGATGGSRPRRRGRSIALIGGVLVVAIVGAVAWFVLRPGQSGSTAKNFWPSDPQLQRTYPDISNKSNDDIVEPQVRGEPDDLIVIAAGDESSQVTRYVDGEPVWQTFVDGGVPQPVFIPYDDVLFVVTKRAIRADGYILTRLEPTGGGEVWKADLADLARPRMIGDRLFTTSTTSIVEYDPATGATLNRLDADYVEVIDDEILTINVAESTAQRYDLSFTPLGQSVNVETSGVDGMGFVVTRYHDRWLYYRNQRLVGVSDTGDTLFECDVSIEEPFGFHQAVDDVLVMRSGEAAEAFTVTSDSCAATWNVTATNVYAIGQNLVVETYRDDSDDFERQVYDISSGASVATTTGQVVVSGDGYAVIIQEGRATSIDLASGVEQWTIPIPFRGEVRMRGTMVVVNILAGGSTTVQIFADE